MSLRKLGRHVQIGLTSQKEKGQIALPVDLIVVEELQDYGLVVDSNLGATRRCSKWSSAESCRPKN